MIVVLKASIVSSTVMLNSIATVPLLFLPLLGRSTGMTGTLEPPMRPFWIKSFVEATCDFSEKYKIWPPVDSARDL